MRFASRAFSLSCGAPLTARFRAAGNKSDLEEQRQVKLAKAKEYADSVGAIIYETSAKDNAGIEELFVDVSRRLIELQNKKKVQTPAGGGVSLKQSDRNAGGGGGGCQC